MEDLIRDSRNNPLPIIPLIQTNTQVVDGTSASAQSTVLNATGRTYVRIATIKDIYIAFGTNPTASATTILLPAGSVESFVIAATHKIAVFGGIANITKA